MMRPLWLSIIAVSSVAILLAQSPPVKMGLWEKKIVMTSGSGQPTTLKAKNCVTPETWEQMVANSSKQHKECTVNTVKNAHGYTFQGTCAMDQGNSVQINGSTTIQDSEHIVSESHSTATMNGKKRETTSRSTSQFVSSDCGKVKPGEPEIESQ